MAPPREHPDDLERELPGQELRKYLLECNIIHDRRASRSECILRYRLWYQDPNLLTAATRASVDQYGKDWLGPASKLKLEALSTRELQGWGRLLRMEALEPLSDTESKWDMALPIYACILGMQGFGSANHGPDGTSNNRPALADGTHASPSSQAAQSIKERPSTIQATPNIKNEHLIPVPSHAHKHESTAWPVERKLKYFAWLVLFSIVLYYFREAFWAFLGHSLYLGCLAFLAKTAAYVGIAWNWMVSWCPSWLKGWLGYLFSFPREWLFRLLERALEHFCQSQCGAVACKKKTCVLVDGEV
ncbi:hypothetical protein NX059_012417 [Plenodomus lindquistii]|nr:hypothetical protein NX059_012417 [Plenodomus lindquistii]